jgi:hypothetical protein
MAATGVTWVMTDAVAVLPRRSGGIADGVRLATDVPVCPDEVGYGSELVRRETMTLSAWDWLLSALWLILFAIALGELRRPPQQRYIMGSTRAKLGILLLGVGQLVSWLGLLVYRPSHVVHLAFLSATSVLTVAAAVVAYPFVRDRSPHADKKE